PESALGLSGRLSERPELSCGSDADPAPLEEGLERGLGGERGAHPRERRQIDELAPEPATALNPGRNLERIVELRAVLGDELHRLDEVRTLAHRMRRQMPLRELGSAQGVERARS